MRIRVAAILLALCAALFGAAGLVRADAPPESDVPLVERWSADPRLWLALIEWRQRLRVELTSSRELCTAGTLTEVSWAIAGGKPPYTLQIEGSPANADAETIRINCGALTKAEAADEDVALAAKRISAVVIDARGARRAATLDVARARALPAPKTTGIVAYGEAITTGLLGDETKPDGATSLFIMRWRPTTSTEWSTRTLEHKHAPLDVAPVFLRELRQGTDYQFEFAAVRHRLEAETPEALRWVHSSTKTLADPTGLSATATHSTVTVTWDEQPSASFFRVYLEGSSDRLPRVDDAEIYTPSEHDREAYSVVFRNVPSDREYTVRVRVGAWSFSESDDPLEATTTVRTTSSPQGWTAPPRGAQNVRTTTTSNSITVSWDAPYPDAADDSYHLMLFHPTRSGIRHEWVDNGTTSYTFDNLEPGLTYRVMVDHIAVVESTVELEVTTQSRSTASGRDGVQGSSEIPIPDWPWPEPRFSWPFGFTHYNTKQHASMTTDMWSMRSYGLHSGLDVAGQLGDEDEIQAALGGTLHAYQLERSGFYVVYCPDATRPFREQFHLSTEPWVLKPPEADVATREGCGRIASYQSGNVALIFHGKISGTYYMTKYGHLAEFSNDLEAQLNRNPFGRATKTVARGDMIGLEGSTGESTGDHLHFEIRKFTGSRNEVSQNWYTEKGGFVRGCKWYGLSDSDEDGDDQNKDPKQYCAWDVTQGEDPRIVRTVLDPERKLPPPPAALVPAYASGQGGSAIYEGRIASIKRGLLESLIDGGDFVVDLSVGLFRPLFYHGVIIDDDWDGAAEPISPGRPRVSIPGVSGTRPGAEEYDISISCRSGAAMTVINAPTNYEPPARLTVEARVPRDSSCDLTIRTGNDAYSASAQVPSGLYGRSDGKAVRPMVPRVRIERLGQLPYLDGELTGNLEGVHYHVYQFVGVAGKPNLFRSVVGGEGQVPGVVLEVWGSQGGAVYASKPLATRPSEDVPLSWTPQTTGIYLLVVRASHRAEDPPPDGSYTLITRVPQALCGVPPEADGQSSVDTGGNTAPRCYPPVPTGLTVSNVTDNGATLSWSASSWAKGFEVQLDDKDVETTLNKNARSYSFTGLTSGKAHTLSVKATRDGLESAFATLTLLKPPSSITRSTTTHNSVKYTWTDGNPTGSATAAEVKIGAAGTKRTADSTTYHTFNNLSASTRYTFYIRLKNNQGPSAWRTKTVTTPARPTLPPRVRPAQPDPVVTTERVGQRTEYQWRPYGDLPGGLPPDPPGACYYLLFERERYRLAEFETSWRFDESSWMWKLDPASKRQIGLETEDLFTPWVENGRRHTLTCPDPPQGVSGASAPPAGTLLPGDYVMAWGGDWFAFSIPSDAQVQWGSRTVGEQEAMVFSVAGGAEVVIIPSQIATNPPTSDDATLSAIVASFRAETDPAKLPASAQQQTCAEAPARDDAGALTLDLTAQWCSVVSSGGELSVRYGEDQISLTIPAERVWLIFAAAQSESAAAAGIWVMERQSNAYVILNPSDGAELGRHIPADAAALPALLDAIAASAAPPAE